MAYLETKHVAIRGMAACVPKNIELNVDSYQKWGDYTKVKNIIGIDQRHVGGKDICTSDLFYGAAEKLIEELGWNKEDIGAIVCVTQTPDFIQPPVACILQNRLGLSIDTFATDIPHGCSGWVYGLSVITSLMQTGFIKKGFLFSGDTASKVASPEDKSTLPLFGDAGTCTALEYTNEESSIKFALNTDGSGGDKIVIRDGGYRHPFDEHSLDMVDYGDGIVRNNNHIFMDGMSVFSFAISKAPKQIKDLISFFDIPQEAIDYYVLHQANMYMDEKIRKKMKLSQDKVLYCIEEFGNTSSGSIPLTLVSRAKDDLKSKRLNLIGSGFGVGLSWACAYFETNKIVVPNIIEL
jgi:3-oxoacyl-[acyl-carrier-protein] synthase-3